MERLRLGPEHCTAREGKPDVRAERIHSTAKRTDLQSSRRASKQRKRDVIPEFILKPRARDPSEDSRSGDTLTGLYCERLSIAT